MSTNASNVVESEAPKFRRWFLPWTWALPSEKQGGGGFNQLIAKTHRLNNQLIALQLTMGNLIAVCLSAAQITAGVIGLLWGAMGWLALFVTILCFPLAVVVERLSLGGLMILRMAGKELRKERERFTLMLMDEKGVRREPTERETFEHEQIEKRLGRERSLSFVVVGLGVIFSMALGDQFWHKVFSSVGGAEALALSLMCAITISLTFVFSEIYKDLTDEGLIDIVRDSRIDRAVLATQEQDIQIEMAMKAFANFRSDPKKNDREVSKIEKVIGSRVTAFADYVGEVGLQTIQEVPNSNDVKQIEQRAASKRKFDDCKDDLEWLLQRNPDITMQAIANNFGISKSTAKAWVDKVRPKVVNEDPGSPTV